MTSGLNVRDAREGDLAAMKQLADAHRQELGFVRLPALVGAVERGCACVAELDGDVVGWVNWWDRRDGATVLYNIVVAEALRNRGIGTRLLREVIRRAEQNAARELRLKCPTDLGANAFYERLGLTLSCTEKGKRRGLNCWQIAF